MMKICTTCELEQDIEQFVFRSKINNKRHCRCKTCQAKEKRKYYEKNIVKEKNKALEKNKELRLRNCLYVYNYLSYNPCIECKEKDPIVLEFDHRDPTKKIMEVSKMIYTGATLEKIQNEIDKCDVLCANCHRRKTAKQYHWYKWLN